MGIDDALAKALGGRVVTVGSFKDLGDALGLADCGQSDCPVHGTDEEDPNERDPLEMSPDVALGFAIKASAASHSELLDAKPYLARIYMRQSELWLLIKQELRDRLNGIEAEQTDPRAKRIADLELQLSDVEGDKQDIRAELKRSEKRAEDLLRRLKESREQSSRALVQQGQLRAAAQTAEGERDEALRRVAGLEQLLRSTDAPEPEPETPVS